MKHYTANYFLNPVHPVRIAVVGAGGTGSQVMQKLGRINHALKELGHMGFNVFLYDDDLVSESNIGRQLFTPEDIGASKAHCIISRINRFYGTQWFGVPSRFKIDKNDDPYFNMVISCVDSVKSRREIYKYIDKEPYDKTGEQICFYWMDIGNSQQYGQVVLGSVEVPQPTDEGVRQLSGFFDLFPFVMDHKHKGPSCSLAEALITQDLFINSMLAELAGNMLWKMFRKASIDYNYVTVNIELMALHSQLKSKIDEQVPDKTDA